MPKKRKPGRDESDDAAAPERGTGKRRARLEERLGRLVAQASKRTRRLDEVRLELDKVRARIAALEAGRTDAAEAGASDAATRKNRAAPEAYCMRDRRRVAIAGAKPVVLKNGRHALAGTCPDCGARVVAIVRSKGAG